MSAAADQLHPEKRQAEGIAQAKTRGVYKERARVLTDV